MALDPLYEMARLTDVARALWLHRQLMRHDRWSRARLRRHQEVRLAALVRHAIARSPFYREHYRHIDPAAPIVLSELPTIDKRMIMTHFDRVVTDPRLKLEAIERHLKALKRDAYYLGAYRALATAGTSGLRGIFVFNRREWSIELANSLRWHSFMQVRPRLFGRPKISAIGAGSPIHVSARLTGSGNVGLFRLQLLGVAQPLGDLVAALNRFQPEVLLAYSSVAALLSLEQLDGRLRIKPRVISTHSETLTPEMARRIERAWGVRPFNHYGLTELSTFGAECPLHRGMHALEDLFIAELVDEDYRPVEPGRLARRLLLTNLYNFTQPLIRYDVSDMLALSPEPCPCGRPYPLISAIGGRREEIIAMAGPGGTTVMVPPTAVIETIETFGEIAEFQVFHEKAGILIRFVPRRAYADADLIRAVRERLVARLDALGASPVEIRLERVDALGRRDEHMGKVGLIRTGAHGTRDRGDMASAAAGGETDTAEPD